MYHIFFVAKNNAKKQKGDIITLLVLSLLASLMLYIGVSVLTGLGNIMDTSAREHNTCHIYYWVPEAVADKVEDKLTEEASIKEFERNRTEIANLEYRNASSGGSEWMNFEFLFGSYKEKRDINRLNFDTKNLGKDDILVPYYIKTDFAVGDKIEFKFEDEIKAFTVAGFIDDPLFGSPINITIYNMYIDPEVLDDLIDKHEISFARGSTLKFRGEENCDVYKLREALWTRFQTLVSDGTVPDSSVVIEFNWWDMKDGGSFMTQIVMAVFLTFALIIMVIALIIISFSIRNFIERNMKNTGILEATGYKTGELSLAIITENALAALAGSILGVVIAAMLREALGTVVALVLGLPWNQPYNLACAAGIVLAIVIAVVLACLISTRQLRRISVLECLRGGLTNHNFKHNHFPFDKSAMPIPLTLSLKELVGDKRRNIVLALIVAIIAISTNFGFAMVSSFGGNTDAIQKLSGLEVPDLQVRESRSLREDLEKIGSIDKILMTYNFDATLSSSNETASINCDVYDDPSLLEHEFIIEGRLPENSKEIVLTRKASKMLGVELGDIVYMDHGDNHMDFIVTGIDQKINHMGIKGMVTDKGVERVMGEQDLFYYYIYAKEGVTYDELAKEVGKYTDAALVDSGKMITTTISPVSNSMFIICYVILAITFLIVIFVEILLVRSKIIRERRNYGINKALGFTSGQLMVQTMVSNIPAIVIGILLGSIMSVPATSFIMSSALTLFGIEKVDSTVPFYGLVITFAGILLVALITSLLCSLSIRRVEPVSLLAEE